MDDEMGLLFDAKQWGVVYAFFHPELKTQFGRSDVSEGGDDVGIASLLSGILSSAAGIAGSRTPGECPAETISGFTDVYAGVPASLVYEAFSVTDEKLYWRAEINIASGLSVGDAVVVSVTNSKGDSIDGATLILLGTRLKVSDGIAAYNLAKFQEHLENTNVALTFANGVQVQGTLKLGEEIPSFDVISDE